MIRCVICGAPANTLTETQQFCLEHGRERRVDEGGQAQFALRGRILLPPPRGLARVAQKLPPSR